MEGRAYLERLARSFSVGHEMIGRSRRDPSFSCLSGQRSYQKCRKAPKLAGFTVAQVLRWLGRLPDPQSIESVKERFVTKKSVFLVVVCLFAASIASAQGNSN